MASKSKRRPAKRPSSSSSTRKILQDEGVFAIVIEAVPSLVGTRVTESLDIPTIGIGAGPDTDGQVLVFHDLLGLTGQKPAKFVRQYANLGLR